LAALRSRNLDLVQQFLRRHAFASVELFLGDLNARPRAAATSSAMAEPQLARRHTVDASTASPDHAGGYCGQFCGTYDAYSNDPGEAAASAFYGVNTSTLDPLSPVSIRLPIVDGAGTVVPQR
jgi:hypothetical protein